MPCGSCGRSDNPLCSDIKIKISGTTKKIESKCPLFVEIRSYAIANRGTIATPCRNVPIQCTLCSTASLEPRSRVYRGIWRYNMGVHIRTNHREYAAPGSLNNGARLPLPAKLWEEMEILPKEYEGFGIHTSLVASPFTQVLDSTSFSPVPPTTPSGGKRSRAFTSTSTTSTTDYPPTKQPRRR